MGSADPEGLGEWLHGAWGRDILGHDFFRGFFYHPTFLNIKPSLDIISMSGKGEGGVWAY